ncbi:unnamed protein product [Caenorhabditis angaria]|uniref:Methyltransferase FkbM domain-containing protein n=1 Tax=Caenorhabditis angaria TaxID=860376 RepID=A0A9P1MTM8_9PELO|nr:unnamed protein product [Caenorhabditis angaria]
MRDDRKNTSYKLSILIGFSICILIYIAFAKPLQPIIVKFSHERYGYNGPKNDLDDLEMSFDTKRVNAISNEVQKLINSTEKCDFSDSNSESEGSKIAKSAMDGFQKCIKPIFGSFNGDSRKLFDNWVNSARTCDYIDEYSNLDILGITNNDEIKWLIYPKCQEENTHVTLGVGHDIKAEMKLKKHQPNTKFYGVDPMIDINYDLITKELNGSFFPYALGNETKLQYFPVLNKEGHYGKQSVATVDVGYFFEKLLKLRRIDTLFLDIESGEEYFFDHFSKGGKFDEIGMSICQFNIEFHPGYTHNYDLVYKFLEQTIKDKRFPTETSVLSLKISPNFICSFKTMQFTVFFLILLSFFVLISTSPQTLEQQKPDGRKVILIRANKNGWPIIQL